MSIMRTDTSELKTPPTCKVCKKRIAKGDEFAYAGGRDYVHSGKDEHKKDPKLGAKK